MNRAVRSAVWVLLACASGTWARAELAIPRDALYLLPDGSIHIVADKGMAPLVTRWNDLFARAHPGTRFSVLFGDHPVGIDGIIARVSLLAPVAHDAWESEVDPFKRLNGYRPRDIRVGRIGHAGPGRANPPAIYVNAANPIRSLTLEEVGRIFTTGRMPSDLRRWSQLGVGSEWAKHAIHVYGTRDDGMSVTALRIERFGGRPFVRHYEALADDTDVLDALAGDRYGIGLAWSADARNLPGNVRLVPLSFGPESAPSGGDYEAVSEGRYPLSPHLHLYVDSPPGRPLDPIAREYLRLVLSPEGQRIIAEMKDSREGFVPLAPREAAEELARIE